MIASAFSWEMTVDPLFWESKHLEMCLVYLLRSMFVLTEKSICSRLLVISVNYRLKVISELIWPLG